MTHKDSDKLNPIYADKLWLTKYLYSIADPNTKEGAQWHKKIARNLFIAVGAIVALHKQASAVVSLYLLIKMGNLCYVFTLMKRSKYNNEKKKTHYYNANCDSHFHYMPFGVWTKQ